MPYKFNPFTGNLDEVGAGGSGTSLPAAQDGEALIYENGQWAAGPSIGGVNYSSSATSTYTVPNGFASWGDTWTTDSGCSYITFSNNNLTATASTNGSCQAFSSTTKSTGKWYWEISLGTVTGDTMLGITVTTNSFPGANNTGGLGLYHNGTWFNDSGATVTNISALSTNDVVMFALDADAKKLWVGLNGTWENNGDPAAGTDEVVSAWSSSPDWKFVARMFTAGFAYTIENTGGATITIPYSIDKLDDVDTSTVAPTDGQALLWDNTAQKWEPGTVSGGGTSLPAAQDGEALIYENGQWVAGPVIGGVDYISGTDANWSNVELLLLGNGTNGSTTFTDSSSNALTLAATGNTQISTTQSKYGGASIYFDGNSDYLTVTDSVLALGTDQFTIEFWMYAQSTATNESMLACGNPSTSNSWQISGGSTLIVALGTSNVASTTFPSLNTWHHVAVTRDSSNTVRLFLNGTSVSSATNTADLTASNLKIGANRAISEYFDGYLDDIRITKGVARYTADFTAPTAELPVNTTIAIPYSIDKLDDVDTSRVAPIDGQALLWDNTASKWEPGAVVNSVEDLDDYGLNYNTGATAGTTVYSANNYSTTCGGYRWSVPASNKICFQRYDAGNTDHQSLYSTIISNPTAYAIQINNGTSSGAGSLVMYAQITSAVSDGSNGIILTHDGSFGPYLAGDTPPGTGNFNGYMYFAFISSVLIPVTDGQVIAWDNTNSQWHAADLRTLLGIGEYADDTAAGTGGLSSGEMYYNTTSSSYVLKT